MSFQGRSEGDRRSVTAASTQSRHLAMVAHALEARHDRHPAGLQIDEKRFGIDVDDLGVPVLLGGFDGRLAPVEAPAGDVVLAEGVTDNDGAEGLATRHQLIQFRDITVLGELFHQ